MNFLVFMLSVLVAYLILHYRHFISSMQLNYKKQLHHALYIDNLTQMHNYEYFKFTAQQIWKRDFRIKYALVVVDVAQFKYINDLFGYKVGDKVICHMANILKKNIKQNDLFARRSAAQFIIMVRYVNDDSVRMFLESLSSKMEMFQRTPTSQYKLFFCYGITIVEPFLNKDINELVEEAMRAKKSTKKKHEHEVSFYHVQISEKKLREKEFEDCMEDALKNEEFVVYYQPKYDLRLNCIIGAEALIRWNHPKYGLVAPNEFIPLFEKNGFIVQLDSYVLETVCKNIRQWILRGNPYVPISVNMSRMHIDSSETVRKLKMITDRYRIPVNFIEFEITESAITKNTGQLNLLLNEMRQLGFRIAMDDFGSGYSTLNLLKDVPIDVLKIDKGFFRQDKSTRKEHIILESIVDMAHKLEMKVVAEGVENIYQVNFLKMIDCDVVQGYYYSKPIEKLAFEKLLSYDKQNKQQQQQQLHFA